MLTSKDKPIIIKKALRALGLGLSGAHRTGKTTLAKRIADKNKLPFVQTSLTALANEMGIKIAMDMDFAVRRVFQERALVMFEEIYAEQSKNGMFVTDRTPIDLAAYVMTAWHPNFVSPELTEWANDYVTRCIDATNRWFVSVIIVQPGAIPYVEEAQKGENIDLYRESLNATMIGLSLHDSFYPDLTIMPRRVIDLGERGEFVARNYGEAVNAYVRDVRENHARQ